MKKFITILTFFVSCFALLGCDSMEEQIGYKENVVKELCGVWDMQTKEGLKGTIEFTYDMQIIMTCNETKYYGDYNLYDDENGDEVENSFAITYFEDEYGNSILTEEDEDNGGIYCKLTPLDKRNVYIENLPLFRNETLLLIKH